MRGFIATLILLLLPFAAAFAAPNDVFSDGTGTRVAYGQDARRIVSLAPSVTEMLYFVGLGERVVGRSAFCNYPPEVLQVPEVGGVTDTSLEQIAALGPDLVVAVQGNSLELVGQLRGLGITVLAFKEATTLLEIAEQLETLHRVAAAPGAASPAAIGQWRVRLKQLSISLKLPCPRVFYGMPSELAWSAAPGSYIDDLITRAGGCNVVPAGQTRWPQVGAEFIAAAAPEWIVLTTPCVGHDDTARSREEALATLRQSAIWRKLPAVQREQIVVLDADTLLRPGPRALNALEQLKAALAETADEDLDAAA